MLLLWENIGGGIVGWQKWLIAEFVRSFGVRGLRQDLHLFDDTFLDELLEEPKIFAALKKKMAAQQRPSLATFSLQLSGLTNASVGKLRKLQPGFYPSMDRLRASRRILTRDFTSTWAEGATEMRPYYTRFSEEEEALARAAAAAAESAREAALHAEAVKEAEVVMAAEAVAEEAEPLAQRQRLPDPNGV